MKIENGLLRNLLTVYYVENLFSLSDLKILTRFEVNLWLHINDLYTISRDDINDSETQLSMRKIKYNKKSTSLPLTRL